MSDCAAHSKRIIAGLALVAGLALPVAAEGPRRVVSINLCTDLLAMQMAAPGQLVSVSNLAADPHSSVMAAEAAAYPANYGLVEEVFLLKPDLVVAGEYTARATTSLLERLGIPVVKFAPATSLDDIPAHLERMGAALGREAEAQAMIEAFNADRAALAPTGDDLRPLAALYYANGYSTGLNTLSGRVLDAAGLRNAAAEAGLVRGGTLPLEVLIMAAPDMVIRGNRYPGASRSEDILDHPALAHLGASSETPILADRDWICGTPRILDVVARLTEARATLEDAR